MAIEEACREQILCVEDEGAYGLKTEESYRELNQGLTAKIQVV